MYTLLAKDWVFQDSYDVESCVEKVVPSLDVSQLEGMGSNICKFALGLHTKSQEVGSLGAIL